MLLLGTSIHFTTIIFLLLLKLLFKFSSCMLLDGRGAQNERMIWKLKESVSAHIMFFYFGSTTLLQVSNAEGWTRIFYEIQGTVKIFEWVERKGKRNAWKIYNIYINTGEKKYLLDSSLLKKRTLLLLFSIAMGCRQYFWYNFTYDNF